MNKFSYISASGGTTRFIIAISDRTFDENGISGGYDPKGQRSNFQHCPMGMKFDMEDL